VVFIRYVGGVVLEICTINDNVVDCIGDPNSSTSRGNTGTGDRVQYSRYGIMQMNLSQSNKRFKIRQIDFRAGVSVR